MARHQYNPQLSYAPERDIRDWQHIVALLQESTPTGLFWPLIGTRRSGKTWALHALRHHIGADRTHLLGHRSTLEAPQYARDTIVLVDEPGKHFFLAGEVCAGQPRRPDPQSVARFLDWCQKIHERGHSLLIAMTPAEWRALTEFGRSQGKVSDQDLQQLLPLTPAQAASIARDELASILLDHLRHARPDWLRNPFLVTYLLDRAEQQRATDSASLDIFLTSAIEGINAPTPWNYVHMVFYEGLDARLQEAMRKVACREPADARDLALLRTCGLIDGRPGERLATICDPVLADHLPPPLRIHHISDIHTGPKSAQRVQVTGTDAVAARLGGGAGQGPIRDSYLDHVRQRKGEGTAPHLIIVSGDLTETGQPEEYEAALDLLDQLKGLLQDHPDLTPADQRVLIVGGNHDVDWNATRGQTGARKRHNTFARYFAGYPHPHLERPPGERSLAVEYYARACLEVVLLGSAEYGGEIDDGLIALLDDVQADAVQRGITGHAEDAERLRRRLGRLDPGLVHHKDLVNVRAHAWRAQIRIAVLHHPVSPMPAQVDITAYTGLLNAGAVKDALIDKHITLVLHGHMHSQWFGVESWPNHRQHPHVLRIAAAPSLGSREISEQHGYNEVILSREGSILRVEVRGHVRDGETWKRRSGHEIFDIDTREG